MPNISKQAISSLRNKIFVLILISSCFWIFFIIGYKIGDKNAIYSTKTIKIFKINSLIKYSDGNSCKVEGNCPYSVVTDSEVLNTRLNSSYFLSFDSTFEKGAYLVCNVEIKSVSFWLFRFPREIIKENKCQRSLE